MKHCTWVMLGLAVAAGGADVTARVPDYRVAGDLSNVTNRKQLPTLTAEQKAALVSQAFFARTTHDEQLFVIYENNHYKKVPSFVTTDSVLHTAHVFYDFTLRWLETKRLISLAEHLCQRLYDANLTDWQNAGPPEVKQAYGANAVYAAVALTQLGKPVALPAELKLAHDRFCKLIDAHQGFGALDPADTDGPKVDFSQFVPLGHYTRSDELKRYFKGMMWLGLVPMPLEAKRPQYARQALILTQQIATDTHIRADWRMVYEPTSYFVGVADDLTYEDLLPLLQRCFDPHDLATLADEARMKPFMAAVPSLRAAGIETAVGGVQGREFRLMGQRFIHDSRIFQELCTPKVGESADGKVRAFPLALDIPAVFGSARAAVLLDDFYKEPRYPHYLEQRAKLRAEIAGLPVATWSSNLYYAWLHSLRPLTAVRGEGWPAFMRAKAWQDKSLVTFLGSWTELRHDTILYAKQSAVECGGDGAEPPPPVLGYVEPEVEVYERLAAMMRQTCHGLAGRGLFTEKDQVYGNFVHFIDLLDWLAEVSRTELRGERLVSDDLRAIENFGAQLETLMMSIVAAATGHGANTWWDIGSRTDRNMALIADVHTEAGTAQALEEAVGRAAEIWVIVPHPGKLVAARGATFAWYEFKHPMGDRLTDEAWQTMLEKGKAPSMPTWVKSVFIGPGSAVRTPFQELKVMDTGC